MKKSLKNRLCIISKFFAIIPSRPLIEKKKIYVAAEEKELRPIQTEMVELIALPFPFSSERKIGPSNVVFVQGGQWNLQKIVMRVQDCCFAH